MYCEYKIIVYKQITSYCFNRALCIVNHPEGGGRTLYEVVLIEHYVL